MNVSGILTHKDSDIISVRPDETIESVSALLAVHRIGAVVVLDEDGTLVGILSERDVVRGLATYGENVLSHVVADLMTSKVEVCHPHDNLNTIMVRMTEGRFRHMPVVNGRRLVGLISIGDVVKSRLDEATHEVESLRVYVAGGF